jgi:5-methylcytosine-specific restriction endonuclease McrA
MGKNIPAFYSTPEWAKLKRQIFIRDNGICQYCGSKAVNADHIIPRSRGGEDSLENLVACCRSCNAFATGRVFKDFEDKKRWLLWTRSDPCNHPMVYQNDKMYPGNYRRYDTVKWRRK